MFYILFSTKVKSKKKERTHSCFMSSFTVNSTISGSDVFNYYYSSAKVKW